MLIKKALLLSLIFSTQVVLATTDIDVQLEVPSSYSVLSKFNEGLDEVCAKVENLKYTKGKIDCHPHLRASSSPITITMKLSGDQWELNAIHRDDDTFNVGWKIQKSPNGVFELEKASLLIGAYITALEEKRFIEEIALVEASKDSNVIGLNDKSSYFNKKTGGLLTFEEARDTFKNENPKNGHFWKALLNLMLAFSARGAWQWIDRDRWLIDWEYTYNWESFRSRLTADGHSLDADNFNSNALRSPMMNTLIHLGARSYGSGFVESFLFSFAGSLLWEYIGEFNEKVSINDLILPPISGSILGEVLFRLSDVAKRKLLPIFRKKDLDKYGFDTDMFYNMEFYYGQTLNQFGHYVKLDTSVYYLNKYLEAGERRRKFKGGDVTVLELEGVIGKEGVENFKLFAQTSLLGLQKQNISIVDGQKSGYSVLVGLSTSYDFSQNKYQALYDKIGVLNVLGATAEIHYFYKGMHIKALMNVHGNVSQIKSASVNRLEAYYYDLQQTKYVLETQKYYFAYGMTIQGKVGVEYKDFALNASYKYLSAQSINGLDRYQSIVSDDFKISDARTSIDINASYNFFRNFLISLGYQFNKASGTTRDITDSHKEHFFYGRLGVKF